MKMFFLTQNRNKLDQKFVKSEKFLGCVAKWVEVRKMSEVFWVKLYCKMSDVFR